MRRSSVSALLSLMLMAIAATPAASDEVADFYRGKQVKLIIGYAPGTGYDIHARLLGRHLGRHIPGEPTVIPQTMEGAGSLRAGLYVYNVAEKDGLTIGAFSSGVVSLNILRESGVMYDVDKFFYLGSPESTSHLVFYSRKEAGLNNLEKLRGASGLRIGARPVGHSAYIAARFFAYYLGLKDTKFIPGYAAPELDVALLRGEVDARANTATSVWQRNPDWVEKGLMDFHAILEVPKGLKHDRFGHLPEIESFAKSEKETKLLALSRTFRLAGSPYVLPPGTPKDRVEIVQEAMRKTFKDSDFHREYRKIVGDDASPLLPEELTKAIQDTPRDAELIELFKIFSGPAPLPAR